MRERDLSTPATNQQIVAAKRLLYVLDSQGNIVGKTPLYQRYQYNQNAYLKAKQDYDAAYAQALGDPMKLQNWPIMGVTYRQRVNQAYDEWKTGDAQAVEQAIAVLEEGGSADKK